MVDRDEGGWKGSSAAVDWSGRLRSSLSDQSMTAVYPDGIGGVVTRLYLLYIGLLGSILSKYIYSVTKSFKVRRLNCLRC